MGDESISFGGITPEEGTDTDIDFSKNQNKYIYNCQQRALKHITPKSTSQKCLEQKIKIKNLTLRFLNQVC